MTIELKPASPTTSAPRSTARSTALCTSATASSSESASSSAGRCGSAISALGAAAVGRADGELPERIGLDEFGDARLQPLQFRVAERREARIEPSHAVGVEEVHDEGEARAFVPAGCVRRDGGRRGRVPRLAEGSRHARARSAHEMADERRRVAALERVQQPPQCSDQMVAQRGVGDERRLDAQHGAVGEGWGDADVLDIEQVAHHDVQQQPLLLQHGEHAAPGRGDRLEVQLHAQHEAAPADLLDQQGIVALELAQLCEQAITGRRHVSHQSTIVLGQLVERRQRGAARERVAGEGRAVPQVELLAVGTLAVEAGADRDEAAPSALARHRISGVTPSALQANRLPVRPRPVCTSSTMSNAPCA